MTTAPEPISVRIDAPQEPRPQDCRRCRACVIVLLVILALFLVVVLYPGSRHALLGFIGVSSNNAILVAPAQEIEISLTGSDPHARTDHAVKLIGHLGSAARNMGQAGAFTVEFRHRGVNWTAHCCYGVSDLRFGDGSKFVVRVESLTNDSSSGASNQPTTASHVAEQVIAKLREAVARDNSKAD